MLCKEISQQHHNALLNVLLQFENPDINFQNLVELADNSRVVLDSISGLFKHSMLYKTLNYLK